MSEPVDLSSYDWQQHCWGPGKGGCNPIFVDVWKGLADQLNTGHEQFRATTDGGWPRVGWGDVLAWEMRVTWPYLEPVPSVLVDGHMGASWHALMSISELRRRA